MAFEIVTYNPDFIEQQVDLVWEETEKWKYPYATSYDSIKQQYSGENFDPTTRFYAIEDGKLVGYVTSAVAKDKEKGDYGTLRFPIVKNSNKEVTSALFDKAVSRFKELGITTLRAPAGVGMGNTLELAKELGFEEKSTIFIRSKLAIDDLNVSGNTEGVLNYDDSYEESVKDLYMTKMGLPENQGAGFFDWTLKNKIRKEGNDPNMVSWKLTNEQTGLSGFSYLHRSDHNPENGQFAPVWFKNDSPDPRTIVDGILSAHKSALQPHGLKFVNTYLPSRLMNLKELYGTFGFQYDATFSYEKQL